MLKSIERLLNLDSNSKKLSDSQRETAAEVQVEVELAESS